MKAIVIPSYGDADVLTLTEVPDPVCGPDDVVVNVKATALNRADLLQRRGFYPQPGPKPEFEIPGLEFAGEVAEAGSRVDAWKIGDRVMGLLGADVVLDFIGGSYLEQNLRALAVKGRMIVIGMMGGLTADLNLGVLLQKRLEIRGTLLRARTLEEKATATRAFEKSVLPHVAAGRVRAVVDRSFALAEAAEAHRLMESNANFGKIVLEM
jgi:NADPH:quinone reductase-like Zn-dependent oxidoreductase